MTSEFKHVMILKLPPTELECYWILLSSMHATSSGVPLEFLIIAKLLDLYLEDNSWLNTLVLSKDHLTLQIMHVYFRIQKLAHLFYTYVLDAGICTEIIIIQSTCIKT